MSVDEVLFLAIERIGRPVSGYRLHFSATGKPQHALLPWCLRDYLLDLVQPSGGLPGGAGFGSIVGLADFFGGQLKWVFERVRPCRAFTEAVKIEPSGCRGLFSFPSNLAANTAAIASFLQVLYPASGWVTWPVVALIGFARVYVVTHYVTDVLGGWVLGGVMGGGAA